ncbi:hypothetical protein PS710_02049 [Pseudomonas fluorescens]|uniref:Uncharacterized protein n=1 Tax=Pseudomonas fluorescens TaxID=294 RepID=A0A5E7BN35_PSEFL|nr:hypothetical protein PS710_02049 [Pseudomonas fluorescens]
MISERASDKGKIVHLEEENALLRQRLFGRKSEQTTDPATPQLALFNEAESVAEPVDEACEEEVVVPTKRRGKRKPLPADLPRIEVIHELPEHELTCTCGCRKHAIGEEVSEQLEIVPMQIRVIKHVRKVYGCRDCESAPVTADKPAQLIEKSMASPSVLAMLLTTNTSTVCHCTASKKCWGATILIFRARPWRAGLSSAVSICSRCLI